MTPPAAGHRYRARVLVVAVAAVGAAAATIFALRSRSPEGTVGSATPPAAGASTAANPDACTASRECAAAHPGEPWICRRAVGRCVPLQSRECKVLAEPGDVENDETIWLGTMFPVTGPLAATVGLPAQNAVDLARRDFARVARGAIRTDRNYTPPLGVIACNDAVDSRPAAEHLANVAGVPAVIGFRSSKSLLDLAPSVFLPREVLVLSALSSAPMVTSIPQRSDLPRMLYRTTISTERYLDPIVSLVEDVVQPLALAQKRRRGGELRVATVRSGATTGHGFADSLMRALRFNGRSAVENRTNYRELTYSEVDSADLRATFATFLPDLESFAPDVVIFPPDPECIEALIFPLERALGRKGQKAWFVTTELFQTAAHYPFFADDASRGARFLSVNVAASTLANVGLTVRYNEEFRPKVTAVEAPSTSYDSFYLLGFAATAALRERGAVTGPSLATALSRLTRAGPEVQVGPSALVQGLALAARSEPLRLRGACTDLNYASDTGEPDATMVVYCTTTNASRHEVAAEESNLVYERRAHAFKAPNLRCP